MKKKIIVILLIIALSVSGGQVYAAGHDIVEPEPIGEEITPLFTLISGIFPSLRVSGTTATYSLSVIAASSVNNISATMQLEQLVGGRWVNYGSAWLATSTSSRLTTNGTRTVTSGQTFRMRATITASSNTSSETVTVHS